MSSSAGSGFDEKGQPQDGCWDFVPPVPVTRSYYRCDRRFHPKMLERLYTDDRKYYGYVLIEGEHMLVYKTNTVDHQLLDNLSVKRQNHHNKGGQSAPRFQRKHREEELAYIKKICKILSKSFLKNGLPTISGIIIAGPGDMKQKVLDCAEFSPALYDILVAVMTTTEISEELFIQLLADSMDYLGDEELKQEKKLYTKLLDLIRVDTDRVLFAKEVLRELDSGMVQTVYISESQQKEHQLKETHGSTIHVFKSHLLNDFGGLVATKWY